MIKKIFWISLSVLFLFCVENALFDFFRLWFRPNLLLLLIIVLNLTLGIRYGLAASFWAGLLKDCFSAGPLGAHMLGFVVCSFLIVFIRKLFLHMDTFSFRAAMTAVIVLINVMVVYLASALYAQISLQQVFFFILLPQALSTVFVAVLLFDDYKKCVLKLSE